MLIFSASQNRSADRERLFHRNLEFTGWIVIGQKFQTRIHLKIFF